MAVYYKEGEEKLRPGIYQRISTTNKTNVAGAQDGICAIPVKASWGPLNTVVKHTKRNSLVATYGSGTYGKDYTVPAADAMFSGGATTVYTYRMGTGGAKASKTLDSTDVITAKYPGTYPISVAVQAKIGDATINEFLVYAGNQLVETWEFPVGESDSTDMCAALKDSKYVVATPGSAPTKITPFEAAEGQLEGGENPSVTPESYSAACGAFEPYFYNCIALDVDDDEDISKSLLLHEYLKEANPMGKHAIAVVGEKTSVTLEKRMSHAKAFNDEKVVYLGNGYRNAAGEAVEGVMAICRTAGTISATPSNQAITHAVIDDAVELLETLTYTQYEDAVVNGALMLSLSSDGQVWYDTGINTLTVPDPETQDNGWKKIKRTKVRFEMFDRIDRTLAPKVGRVNCDSDGIGDVVQSAQRVLDTMVSERKLSANPKFQEDPENPWRGDSGWFLIDADDVDALEKIYLHYHFRYSQQA